MCKHWLFALITLLLCAAPALGSDRRYPFQQITLDNGMAVVTLEDFSCPIVAVQVWYHVGSKNEAPGRQGFAHMFEHMMFRGTDRLGETAHFDNIRRVGGNCNAYTAFDNTTYIQQVPSNQLEMVLWLESERMAFLRIDQKGFDTERRVVEEELRQGHNRPYGRVPERLLADIYGSACYGWTPGGQIAHLRDSSVEDLAAFWDRYYVPGNATLVIVGAVRHADAQALARKYFEWLPRCPRVEQPTVKPADQLKPRTIRLKEDKGPLPVVGAVYRTVPESHPDALPLEILMGVLGGGESSRLYLDVVKERKIAQMALAGAFGFEKDGIAGAGGLLLPFGKKKELLDAIKTHIRRLTEEPITSAELAKMKNQLRREEIDGALTAANKARLLGQYAVLFGDAERINRRLAEIDAVTIEDVQRVARAYLTSARRITVSIEPSATGFLGSLLSKDDAEAQKDLPDAKENRVVARTGPKARAARPAGFPDKPPAAAPLGDPPEIPSTGKTLDNRLKVVVVPNHEVPLVTLVLAMRSGAWSEPSPGVALAAMQMLTKGTKNRSARELAEALESNAIRLAGSASLDAAQVTASAMLPQLDLAAELLREVAEHPTFQKDEFEILQKQTRMGLLVASRTPEYLADREFRRRLFGLHPYSRTETGELEDLDRLTLDDLREWWSTNLRPDNCVLYIAGDITPSDAFELAETHFADWRVHTPYAPPSPAPIPEPGSTRIYLVDRPGSVQSQIRVGHLSITREDPMYIPSRVLANIFGGGFNSRLNRAIRVDKGLTYGARGGFTALRFAGEFKISTFTRTPKTADTLRTILAEIEKIRSAPPDEDELADTRTYLTGAFAGDRETPEATVADLWMIELQKLPGDYFRRYLAGVASTGRQDVLAAAKKLIDPAALTIVVVGEAGKIKADLEKIAPVTVVVPATKPPAKEPVEEEPDAPPPAEG
jgi:zinc protease